MAGTFDCPSCGASLLPHGSDTTVVCQYCGKTVVVPQELRERPQMAGFEDSSRPASGDLAAAMQGKFTLDQVRETLRLWSAGQKIPSIKLYRQLTWASLAEAKQALESVANMVGVPEAQRVDALAAVMLQTYHRTESAGAAGSTPAGNQSKRGSWLTCIVVLVFVVGLIGVITLPAMISTGGLANFLGQQTGGDSITVTAGPPNIAAVVTQLPQILSNNGNSFATVEFSTGQEGIGPGMFKDARSIAVDGQGRIYVAEYTGGRVQVFDPTGKFITQWMVDPKMPLRAMAANRKGELFIVQCGAIRRYDGATGKLLGKIEYAGGDGFDDVVVTPDGGLVAVYSRATDDAVVFNSDYQPVRTIEKAISGQTGDSELDMRVAADGLGNIYLLGRFNNAVLKYGPDGKYISRWGSQGDQPGQFTAPDAIAVDGQGRVYVSDFGRIQVFDTTGRYLGIIENTGTTFFNMVFDDQQKLFVAGRTAWYRFAITGK